MNLPLNKSGSMQGAIMDPAQSGWKRDRAKVLDNDKAKREKDPQYKPMSTEEADKEVHQLRDGERHALIDWVKSGANKQAYDDDNYRGSDRLVADLRLDGENPLVTERFIDTNEKGKKAVKIQSIIFTRCVRCHRDGGGFAAEFLLDSYHALAVYASPVTSAP